MVCPQPLGSKHKRSDKENLNYVSPNFPFYANHQLNLIEITIAGVIYYYSEIDISLLNIEKYINNIKITNSKIMLK